METWKNKIYVIGHTWVQCRKWCYDNGLTPQDVIIVSGQRTLSNSPHGHHCIVLLNAYNRHSEWRSMEDHLVYYERTGRVPIFRINDEEERDQYEALHRRT